MELLDPRTPNFRGDTSTLRDAAPATRGGFEYITFVEAGGIEPPSENRRAVATTRLFRDLISPPQRPRTGCDAASHFVFRDCAQGADGVSLAH